MMENQPDENQSQETDDSSQEGKTTNHNVNMFGPYEHLTTRLVDEFFKIFAVFARWVISLSIGVAPKPHKEMIRGAREELKEVDGYLAKLLWSFGILGTAIWCRFGKSTDSKEEAEESP